MLRHVDEPGGISVFSRRIVERLVSDGGDIDYHLLYRDDSQLAVLEEVPGNHVVLPSSSKVIWDQFSVPRYAAQNDLDLIVNLKLSVPLASRVPSLFCLPSVAHYALPELFPLLDRWYTRLTLPLYCRKAKGIITHTETGKDHIIQHMGVDADKISVVPHGVHEWLGPADESEVEAIREEYELRRPFVLFLGGITPMKNIGGLLDAFSIVRESHPELALVLVGFRRFKDEAVFKRIQESDLAEHVQYLGYVPDDDLAGLYSAATVFVLPSWYEGFGIPVLEAMACGCPVVASTGGALPEVCGDAALLADPDDAPEMADAIGTIVEDEDVRAECVEKGLARSREFTWSRTAEGVEAAIQNVLEQE